MKQTVQLGALSAINIGLAFLFQWYVLTHLGPGVETDALFAGMTLPQLVLAVISGSLMHVLVPLLAGEEKEQLRHDAWGFLVLVGAMFGSLAIILYATAPWWIPATLPGFNVAAQTLTVDLTRIQLIGMVFAAINGVQWAAYHARQQFVWAEFTPILASAFALGLLVVALPRYGVTAAAWISTMRMGLQTLLLAPGMGRPVWPDLRSPAISAAWQRIKPLMLGSLYYKTDPLVDRYLLSIAESGSVSLYYLAQQIYGAVSQVTNKAISAPMVPILSKLYKAGDHYGFQRIYRQKLIHMTVLSCFGLLILGSIGQSILGLIIGHGHVSAENVKELWWIMIWLSGMFLAGGAGQICSLAFYSCGDTKTPVNVGMLTYTIYIPIKVMAFYIWGVIGLAMATSIYYTTDLFILIHLLKKKIQQ